MITRDADSVEAADLVGDRIRKTRSQLIAEGFKKDLVSSLPKVDHKDNRDSNINAIRNYDQGGDAWQSATLNEWASETVEVYDLYVKIDFDGDGIAERRHVMMSGNKILINEY